MGKMTQKYGKMTQKYWNMPQKYQNRVRVNKNIVTLLIIKLIISDIK